MRINFYWRNPENFPFLCRLTILSHLKAGHECVMWTDKKQKNKSIYWIDDFQRTHNIKIKDINEIFDVSSFEDTLRKQGNLDEKQVVRLGSDLWSFHLLYKTGETYCDCDIIALRNWDCFDRIFTSDDNGNHFTVALMRPGSKELKLYKDCIKNIVPDWKNMELYTHFCRVHGKDFTVPHNTFHPFLWYDSLERDENRTHKIISLRHLPQECYGYHWHGYMLSQSSIQIDHKTYLDYQYSILWNLQTYLFDKIPAYRT